MRANISMGPMTSTTTTMMMMLGQKMMLALLVLLALGQQTAAVVTIERSVYRDLVVEIKDNVPVAECTSILINLEVSPRPTH